MHQHLQQSCMSFIDGLQSHSYDQNINAHLVSTTGTGAPASLISDHHQRDSYLRSLSSARALRHRFFFASMLDIRQLRQLAAEFSEYVRVHGRVPPQSSSIIASISHWYWKQRMGDARYDDCRGWIIDERYWRQAVANDWLIFYERWSHRTFATPLTHTPHHRMSSASLLFGQMIGDVLGINPIQGALMSPAGGLVGAGDSMLRPHLETGLRYWTSSRNIGDWHSAAHDAAGFLWKNFAIGTGYAYSPISHDGYNDDTWLPKRNGLAGQRSGVHYWKRIMPPSLTRMECIPYTLPYHRNDHTNVDATTTDALDIHMSRSRLSDDIHSTSCTMVCDHTNMSAIHASPATRLTLTSLIQATLLRTVAYLAHQPAAAKYSHHHIHVHTAL